jgi:hypothetical protein
MRAFSSQRSLSSVMARNWTDVFHTGARWSRRGRDAHSHLRDACAGGNLPGHRRPLHGREMVDPTIAISLMNVFTRIAIGFGCDPTSS